MIPVALFWVLLQEMPGAIAAEQLREYYPQFLAHAGVVGNREARPALANALRTLEQLANPTRPPR